MNTLSYILKILREIIFLIVPIYLYFCITGNIDYVFLNSFFIVCVLAFYNAKAMKKELPIWLYFILIGII